MSFKKTIKTGSASNEEIDPKTLSSFPKGARYVMANKIYTIIEAFTDSSTDWRRIMSDAGEEELVMLSTLKKDLESKAMVFIPSKNK